MLLPAIKRIFLIFILFFSQQVFSLSSLNLRKCLLLPITTDIEQSKYASVIYSELEESLKKSSQCNYVDNIDLVSILQNYQNNLKEYLNNTKILKLIANKSLAGSLIRIHLEEKDRELPKINLSIVGDSDESIYLDEVIELEEDGEQVDKILSIINKFFENVPFDFYVLDVDGEHITLENRGNLNLNEEDTLLITRVVQEKRHPKLKNIVSFETQKLGIAKVIKVSPYVIYAGLIEGNNERIKTGDWAKWSGERVEKMRSTEWREEERLSTKDYGRVAHLGPYFVGGSTSRNQVLSKSVNLASGITYGAGIKGELWITRNYIIDGRGEFKTGALSKVEGSLLNSSYTFQSSHYHARVGYRYLPMEHFYGPRLDVLLGYTATTLTLNGDQSDGMATTAYSGPSLALRADMPLIKDLRFSLDLNVSALGSLEQTPKNGTSPESIYSYGPQLGFEYLLYPKWSFDIKGGITFHQATFGELLLTDREIDIRSGINITI